SESFIDLLDASIKISLVTIEALDEVNWHIFAEVPIPFVQTTANGCARIMRVKREQHHLIAARLLEAFHRLSCKWIPVAHCHKTTSVDTITVERGLQGTRLALRETPDRRAAADHRIVMFNFFGAGGGNQLGERTTSDAGEREVDNVGIAKQVIKKR